MTKHQGRATIDPGSIANGSWLTAIATGLALRFQTP